MEKRTTFGIGDTARMAGVSQKQLRHWEGLYIPQPERVVYGMRAYRRYSQEQVNLVRRIKTFLDQGFTLKTASEKARSEILSKKGGAGDE